MSLTLRSAVFVAMLASLTAGCGNSSGDGEALADKVTGDPVRGEQLYQQCAACHSLATNAAGPRHCQLFGRSSGTVPDYEYSQAMRDAGLVWNVQTLDEFLTSPITYVSGTKMGFAGFTEAADRADVIAFLHQANNDPAVCPPG